VENATSLIELLTNPLSQQAGKWLVIRRRPESSGFKQNAFFSCWIPACAGMTAHLSQIMEISINSPGGPIQTGFFVRVDWRIRR
jgi:hypothetical protein